MYPLRLPSGRTPLIAPMHPDPAQLDDEPDGTPQRGDVIAGKYQIEETVGVGGMGVVLAARHLQLGQRVALKILRASEAHHEEATARFLREARAGIASSRSMTPPLRRTDPSVLWDAVLTGHEASPGLSYSLGVYNLFDRRYELPVSSALAPRSLPQTGRTLLAAVSLQL